MPYIADEAKRDTHLHLVAKYAVDAIGALISPAAGDVRANVFGLTQTRDGLVCVESSRKKKPSPFLAGEAETREALEFLSSGERIVLYHDLSKSRPASWGRQNQTGYKSFMSVPIAAPDPDSHDGELKVYGMVSIDAAAVDVFSTNDEHVAELVADLVATAFAIDDATAHNA
ncbi:hypothetical protein B7R21_02435 [Subtercola boreus]|uniref:GAF domain-containing protein n=1 Tax=Subtercola boreus TaxID=120213 RepID=A0A3E0W540_9MICO|nr:GAF domain-containing protein [Subtercola boreus]RFA16257.1 hypothetical protein B7R21_02435 [Subtercola boreus]